MEAANKGASRVPGARNMGMGITLPFEEGESFFSATCKQTIFIVILEKSVLGLSRETFEA